MLIYIFYLYNLIYIYILIFYLTFFLAYTLTFYLTFFPVYVSYTLAFYLIYFLASIPAFYSGIFSGIHSGIQSERYSFGCLAAIHCKVGSPKLTGRLRGMGFSAKGAFALTAFFQKSLRISFARCFSRHYFCGCCWIL